MKLSELPIEYVPIKDLKPHEKNYRIHGPDQLAHIKASIMEHGVYKNAVITSDNVLLTSHGVRQACVELGIETLPCKRLPILSSAMGAFKILTGDNEISNLAEVNDRLLSEILREVATVDLDELVGTGFDGKQLANLVYVTRHSDEIKDHSAAAEWLGLPSYDAADGDAKKEPVLEVTFKTHEDRDKFVNEIQLKIRSKLKGRKWSTMWPYVERTDNKSVKFEPSEIQTTTDSKPVAEPVV